MCQWLQVAALVSVLGGRNKEKEVQTGTFLGGVRGGQGVGPDWRGGSCWQRCMLDLISDFLAYPAPFLSSDICQKMAGVGLRISTRGQKAYPLVSKKKGLAF